MQKQFHKRKISVISTAVRRSGRRLFSILVFSVLLTGCSGLLSKKVGSMASASVEFTFEQHEIDTGSTKHQTILTGFFLGGDFAELAVVSSDENDNRHLHIYAFNDSIWELRLDTTLRPEVLFVDVANIGGRDRLITYEHGHLNWFDPNRQWNVCWLRSLRPTRQQMTVEFHILTLLTM